jgi:nicotinate phosphoribosyltransferase
VTDRLNTATTENILSGEITDKYFVRTEETLDHADHNPSVLAEVTADQFEDGEREVLAGVDTACTILEGLPVNVKAYPEGSRFDGGPVMEIEGPYRSFARYETAILCALSHASGFATKTERLVDAANGTPVHSFGSRHIHPSMAPVLERAAYIGGVDGYSNTAAEDILPGEATGTMPHALMLSFDNLQEAWKAFDGGVPEDVPRVVLADTFTDEAYESLLAAETLDDLDGVRLDTTGSRRGDFEHIIKEVRHKLDNEGHEDVDIFVSGGLGVEDLVRLNDLVDGFGVGSAITDAPSVDFSLDIVRVDGESTAKRGKLPGQKDNMYNMDIWIEDGEKVKETDIEQARQRTTLV